MHRSHSRRGNKIWFCAIQQSLPAVQDMMQEHVIQEPTPTRWLSDPLSPLPGLTVTLLLFMPFCSHVYIHIHPDSHSVFPSQAFSFLATTDIPLPWTHLFPELTPHQPMRQPRALPGLRVSWIYRCLHLCQSSLRATCSLFISFYTHVS